MAQQQNSSLVDGPIRMGMVGGGIGAFIGPIHKMAAALDGHIQLVAGCFSSDALRSKQSAAQLYGVPISRAYATYQEMLQQEQALPKDERIQFVTIVTPNHLHHPVALAVLQADMHVVCDKPVAMTQTQAQELADVAAAQQKLFCVTHNYTGYPMIREARALIEDGRIGNIRRVVCEYLQGWLAEDVEQTGNKQAQWRTDPNYSGVAGCFGDIGSHCQNLVETVTGLNIVNLAADLSYFVPGRQLEDDGNVLLRFDNQATGVIMASQIAVGEENALTLRVYGDKGGFEWRQMEPNSLLVRWPDRSYEVRRTGGVGLSAAANAVSRLPAGHPEGYIESFATIYEGFANDVRALEAGTTPLLDYPTIADGVRSMAFIEQVVASSKNNSQWVSVE